MWRKPQTIYVILPVVRESLTNVNKISRSTERNLFFDVARSPRAHMFRYIFHSAAKRRLI